MTSIDHEFVDRMEAAGIVFVDPSTAIDLAFTVCDAFFDEIPYGDLFDATMASLALTADQTDILLTDSVFYYCPEQLLDLVPE